MLCSFKIIHRIYVNIVDTYAKECLQYTQPLNLQDLRASIGASSCYKELHQKALCLIMVKGRFWNVRRRKGQLKVSKNLTSTSDIVTSRQLCNAQLKVLIKADPFETLVIGQGYNDDLLLVVRFFQLGSKILKLGCNSK